jgi:Zn-dependent protease
MFYRDELKDILIAILALTFIFWLADGNYNFSLFPIFLFLVVISFLFHELAHRWVAIKFGYDAFFKLFPQGIIFGILFAFLGFIFVAPGAVVILPRFSLLFKSRKRRKMEWGLISASGPLTNLFFAFIFLLFTPVLKIAELVVSINSWLAFFNLLPLPPLDGSKVIVWKWQVWLLLMGIASFLVFFRHLLI